MVHSVKSAFAWFFTTTVLSIAVGLALFRFGPSLEVEFFPPYTHMSGGVVSTDATRTILVITGEKTRDCRFEALNGDVLLHGTWIRGTARMLDENNETLKPEDQRLGPGSRFVRRVEITPGGELLRLSSVSTCHSLWSTIQPLVQLRTTTIPQ